MATASRRISRKQLRQPDWFQLATENALEYFQTHKPVIFSAAAAAVVIVAIVWGWQIFKAKQDIAASYEFTKALALYQSEKYRDAIPAFETVQTYRWSRYAVLAHLYLANSYLATKDIDKATSAAQRSLTATRPDTLYRQIALFTLASAEEQKNQCRTAIATYKEYLKDNPGSPFAIKLSELEAKGSQGAAAK